MSDADVIALALAARPMPPGKPAPQPGPRIEDRLRYAQKMDAPGDITGFLARHQPLSPTSVDVNQSVLDIQLILRRAIPPGIEIKTRLCRNAGLVLADRGQFEAVLLQLAFNARDAMPEGGRLTIGTADITFDAAYAASHPGVMAGRYVLVAVSDSGPAMTPDAIERMFEPLFATTGGGTEHSGLGLSQICGHAKQLGGLARIDSEAGCGTTVQLFFPRVGDAMPIPSAP